MKTLALISLIFAQQAFADLEWSTKASASSTVFQRDPESEPRYKANEVFTVQPRMSWEHDSWKVVGEYFFQLGRHDGPRDDVRDFYVLLNLDSQYLKAGRTIEYWGVTESQQLTNIINQTDIRADIFGDERLGQTLIKWGLVTDRHELSLYLLPEFRARRFPAKASRPRFFSGVNRLPINTEKTTSLTNPDWVARVIGSWDAFEYSLSLFDGLSREPLLALQATPPNLELYYETLKQLGADFQYTGENLLLKAEGVLRQTKSQSYSAITYGFEYTFFDVLQSGGDIGGFLEHLVDKRDSQKGGRHLLYNDNHIFYGLRWTGNDTANSSLLAGFLKQTDTRSQYGRLQFELRGFLGLRYSLDSLFIVSQTENDNFAAADNFVKITGEFTF
ncbi:hypothetical protein N9D31_00875 [Oligoflexaceae bacterium]|nr:hypothetical protein [Oligoflexaceae bacterium]